MSWKGPVAWWAERLARKRRGRLHPAVGLPMDAPEYLETENGSFLRVLPEDEHLPFIQIASRPLLRVCVLVLGSFMLGVLILLASALVEGDPDLESIVNTVGPLVLILVMASLASSLLVIFLQGWLLRRSMAPLLSRREARLFEPGETWAVVAIEDARTFHKGKFLSDDFCLMSIAEGCVEFEMSRAQVRVSVRDLDTYIHVGPQGHHPGSSFRCVFGDWEWSITAQGWSLLHDVRPLRERIPGVIPGFGGSTLATLVQAACGMREREIRATILAEKLDLEVKPFVVTSERRFLRLRSWGISLLGYLGAAALVGLAVWGVTALAISSFLFWVCVGLLCLMLWAVIRCIFHPPPRRPRGTWSFHAEGVAFEPKDQPPVFLRWDEVERVWWPIIPGGVSFQLVGKGVTIRMSSMDVYEEEAKKAREIVERRLEAYFDLGRKRRSFSWWRIVAWVVLCPILAFLIVLLILFDARTWRLLGPIGILLFAVLFLMVAVPLAVLMIRQHREIERLNPEWRERRTSQGGEPAEP